jgi:serine/threonine-protein kinase
MAEVFLARSSGPLGFEKTLVVKRIRPAFAEDPAFLQMFLSEARLAARLNHPNLTQIFDFGECDGSYFLAMEYVDGPNLKTVARQVRAIGRRLPDLFCARIVALACEGLAYAHELTDAATGQPLGLIHRDVSADNILIARTGAVKVVDFGIAKSANQAAQTQAGVLKGKIAYMAPEQLEGKPLDARLDVYALGVVLYELLTGQKPFDGGSDFSLIHAILTKPLVPVETLRPDVPEPLRRIVERALARRREDRFQSCRELQAALEHFIIASGKPAGAAQVAKLLAQLEASRIVPREGVGPTPPSGLGHPAAPGTPAFGLPASGTPAFGLPAAQPVPASEDVTRRVPAPEAALVAPPQLPGRRGDTGEHPAARPPAAPGTPPGGTPAVPPRRGGSGERPAPKEAHASPLLTPARGLPQAKPAVREDGLPSWLEPASAQQAVAPVAAAAKAVPEDEGAELELAVAPRPSRLLPAVDPNPAPKRPVSSVTRPPVRAAPPPAPRASRRLLPALATGLLLFIAGYLLRDAWRSERPAPAVVEVAPEGPAVATDAPAEPAAGGTAPAAAPPPSPREGTDVKSAVRPASGTADGRTVLAH